MATKQEKVERLRKLSRKEIEVLYYFCKGKTDDEISLILEGLTIKALQARRTGIYKKLEIDVPDVDKQNYLNSEYCPLVSELIPSDDDLKRWRPSVSSDIGEDLGEDGKKVDPNKAGPPTTQSSGSRIPLIAFIGGVALLILCAVGYFAYSLGQRPVITSTPTETATLQITDTLQPSSTPLLTDTPQFTDTPTSTLTPSSTPTPAPTNTKSPIGLMVGDELRDNRVTLKLDNVQYNQGYDRVGQRIAPVSFGFEFTNHSGETIVVQFDKSNFVIEDNTGRTAECWFYHISGAVEKWNSTLNDGDTLGIGARCGLGQLPEDVTMYTLTVHPFTSLPESTWVAEVPH